MKQHITLEQWDELSIKEKGMLSGFFKTPSLKIERELFV